MKIPGLQGKRSTLKTKACPRAGWRHGRHPSSRWPGPQRGLPRDTALLRSAVPAVCLQHHTLPGEAVRWLRAERQACSLTSKGPWASPSHSPLARDTHGFVLESGGRVSLTLGSPTSLFLGASVGWAGMVTPLM